MTSVETGSLFGAMVAEALDREWDALGQPDPFVVIEAGAGNGRQGNREPPRPGHGTAEIDEIPEECVKADGVDELPRRPPHGRLLKLCDDRLPLGDADEARRLRLI